MPGEGQRNPGPKQMFDCRRHVRFLAFHRRANYHLFSFFRAELGRYRRFGCSNHAAHA